MPIGDPGGYGPQSPGGFIGDDPSMMRGLERLFQDPGFLERLFGGMPAAPPPSPGMWQGVPQSPPMVAPGTGNRGRGGDGRVGIPSPVSPPMPFGDTRVPQRPEGMTQKMFDRKLDKGAFDPGGRFGPQIPFGNFVDAIPQRPMR